MGKTIQLTAICILSCITLILQPLQANSQTGKEYDLVIYGGTSSGVSAAIQASRMGKTAVLIEPTTRIGGLTTGGLGQTDIGNKQAIGGIAREFYQNVKKYYENPEKLEMAEKGGIARWIQMKMRCGHLSLLLH